jgi:hypothetical protein
MRKIEDIKPYARNPRKNNGAVKAVAHSIEQFGFRQPIVVDSEGVIIAGHTRWKAAQELGLTEVPVHVAADLTAIQVKALRLADNKTHELSDWDLELLPLELGELKDLNFDLGLCGFGDKEVEMLLPVKEGLTDPDEIPEVPEPITKRGDLWLLGEHRLLCGDSTCEADVQKLMAGKKADMVFTDPPYGISIVKMGKVGGGGMTHFGKVGGGKWVSANYYRPIQGDDKPFDPRYLLNLANRQIIFGANYFADKLPISSCWIVWDKETGTNNFADVELLWTSFDRPAKLYRYLWAGLRREGSRKEELIKRVHPTQKPVGLCRAILLDFSSPADLIIDPYLGSGTTIIACEQLNRICYAMEIDPHYCDVAVKRWENFTGHKAELAK